MELQRGYRYTAFNTPLQQVAALLYSFLTFPLAKGPGLAYRGDKLQMLPKQPV